MSGHLHGYAAAQLIQQLSGELLRVEDGSPASGTSRRIIGGIAFTNWRPAAESNWRRGRPATGG